MQLKPLEEFIRLLNDDSFDSLELKFDSIVYHLLNMLCLRIGKQIYKLTEVEIYYHDSSKHADPYTHKAPEQLECGTWYYNGFGIDITFGNPERKIYAGILLRGLKRIGDQCVFISGPSNVLKEIFASIGSVHNQDNSLHISEMPEELQSHETPIKTTRIGLPKKEDDRENYHQKKYRYLVELVPDHRFKEKEKVLVGLMEEGIIDAIQAAEILGYRSGRLLQDSEVTDKV